MKRNTSKGNLVWRNLVAVAVALAMAGTLPAANAAETAVELGPTTTTPDTVNGVSGYWVEYDEYTYESVVSAIKDAYPAISDALAQSLAAYLAKIGKSHKDVDLAAVAKRWTETGGRIDVVAYYRPYRSRWLDALSRSSFDEAGGRRDSWWQHVNEGAVQDAVSRVGWGTVYNWIRDKTSADWQNHGVLFIDPLTNAIVGHHWVENSYDARNLVGGLLNQDKTVNLNTGSFAIRLNATSALSSPIVLDLAGLGRPDLLAGSEWKALNGRKLAMGAVRDFNLDGTTAMSWEWIGPKSGLLVWNADGKGNINSGTQLFGNHTFGKKWKDGYDALATLDKNKDGQLAPDEFAKLGVWVDANSNGLSEPGEVKTLPELGIESISVKAERDAGGNAWSPAGFVRKMPDGSRKTLATWDWMSMGVARASGATYVWVGKHGDKELGGYFNLSEDKGTVRGVSVPTIGVETVEFQDKDGPRGLLAAFVITGKRKGDTITWKSPHSAGQVTSEVRVDEGGKHLYGKTKVKTKTDSYEYRWQADLVTGSPLGAKAPAPRAAR